MILVHENNIIEFWNSVNGESSKRLYKYQLNIRYRCIICTFIYYYFTLIILLTLMIQNDSFLLKFISEEYQIILYFLKLLYYINLHFFYLFCTFLLK